MCGIVGLHLRNPELVPQLGRLLTDMLCEMADRGSDSAGVAVYGDPNWSPPGHGCVSLLDVEAPADEVAAAVATRLLGNPVTVTRIGATYQLSAAVDAEALLAAAREVCYPGALVAGFGADLTVLKGVGHPRDTRRRVGPPGGQGWQGVGPHPDGHRVGGHTVGRAPLRRRTRTVPGAQRVLRQPRHHPPRTASPTVSSSTARTTPRSAPASSRSSWPRAATSRRH